VRYHIITFLQSDKKYNCTRTFLMSKNVQMCNCPTLIYSASIHCPFYYNCYYMCFLYWNLKVRFGQKLVFSYFRKFSWKFHFLFLQNILAFLQNFVMQIIIFISKLQTSISPSRVKISFQPRIFNMVIILRVGQLHICTFAHRTFLLFENVGMCDHTFCRSLKMCECAIAHFFAL